MRKLLHTLCAVFACLHLTLAFADGGDPQLAPRAFLDQSQVNAATRTVQLTGWAVLPQDAKQKPTLHVKVDGAEVFAGQPQPLARPDVAKVTGHADWGDSGWTVTAPLPPSVEAGPQPLEVTVQFGNTPPVQSIPSAPQNATINVPGSRTFSKAVVAAVVMAFALALTSFAFAPSLSRMLSRWTGRTVGKQAPPVIGMVICFAMLVGMGVSGSSLHNTEGAGFPIQGISTSVIANQSQPIRSDEWLVLSTMAIGQARHQPPFPIVNSNLGPDGQNMLVVGMTAVPVWSVAALGRPATWGYFFLPLPQALAWHWWFPAFACVLGLWACLSVLLPGQWRTGFVLSVCFVLSPYVIAWSLWPAYLTMFAAVAFAAVVTLLKGRRRAWQPVLAAVIGMSAAGFTLTLYPAWQVPLAYLFALLLAGVLVRDWRSLRFSFANVTWLVLGLALAAVIVGGWWLEARDAIAAMVSTLYPGQRTTVPGGGMMRWYMAEGFTNFVTLYHDLQPVSNQSEASSFTYFLFPALVGALLDRVHTGRNRPILVAVLVFLFITFWYQYVGIPGRLAALTQWGRSFPTRADIAMGVASFALLALALAQDPRAEPRDDKTWAERIGPALAAILWIALIGWSMSLLPEPIASLMDRPHRVFMLVFVGWCSYALASRWSSAFLVSLLALLVFTTAGFNPWIVVRPTERAAAAHACIMGDGRTLVLGSHFPAMTLMASGCKVLNGVSYYPQMSLWHALDPDGQQAAIYNRYQHLMFDVGDLKGSSAPLLVTPQTDTVQVTVDPTGFNFARLPISYVLIRANRATALASNPSLRKMPAPAPGWARFQVTR